jgi:hypothetical protein
MEKNLNGCFRSFDSSSSSAAAPLGVPLSLDASQLDPAVVDDRSTLLDLADPDGPAASTDAGRAPAHRYLLSGPHLSANAFFSEAEGANGDAS